MRPVSAAMLNDSLCFAPLPFAGGGGQATADAFEFEPEPEADEVEKLAVDEDATVAACMRCWTWTCAGFCGCWGKEGTDAENALDAGKTGVKGDDGDGDPIPFTVLLMLWIEGLLIEDRFGCGCDCECDD